MGRTNVFGYLGVLALLVLGCGVLSARASGGGVALADGAGGDPPRVLIVHSYHKGFSWTDGVDDGIHEALGVVEAEIFTEYLDSKRRPLETVGGAAAEYLARKYAGLALDVVILSDNNALTLVREHPGMFPGVPLVFCGINNFVPGLVEGLGDRVTGVVERVDPAGTVRLIRRLQPDADRLVVVTGVTETGAAVREEVEASLSGFAHGFEVEWWTGEPTGELVGRLRTLTRRDAVLLVLFNRDGEGRYYSYEDAGRMISNATSAPVYGMWDFYLGHGVVGGQMASSRDQGISAGHLARSVLKGGELPGIVMASPNRTIFDFPVLRGHGLDPGLLPAGVELRDRPRVVRWPMVALIAFGTLLAAMLLVHGVRLALPAGSGGAISLSDLVRRNVQSVVILLGLGLLAAFVARSWYSAQDESRLVRERVLEGKKSLIKTMIDQAVAQIELQRESLSAHGYADEEIRRLMAEQFSEVMFAGGEGYIFIIDHDGTLLANRARPDLVGQNSLEILDSDGVPVFRELIAASRRPGGGYVNYRWEKPSVGDRARKLSYTRGIEGWGWAIGAGLYLDDIESEVTAVTDQIWNEMLVQIGIIFGLGVVVLAGAEAVSRRMARRIGDELAMLTGAVMRIVDRPELAGDPGADRALDPDGYGVVEFSQIASAARQSHQQVRDAQKVAGNTVQMTESILEAIPVGLCMVGRDMRILRVNMAALRLMGGRSQKSVMGEHCRRFFGPEPVGRRSVWDGGDPVENEERVLLWEDGHRVPILKTAVRITLDGEDALLEAFVDITDRKLTEKRLQESNEKLQGALERERRSASERDDALHWLENLNAELEKAATTDMLTGLPNRTMFMERLERRLNRYRVYGEMFAVLFFDFDRFKIVNDSLGHDIGDALLCDIAGILRRELGEEDTVGRFGGDEFVVILGRIADTADAVMRAEHLLEEFAKPHELDGHQVVSTASIGLVTSELGYESPDEMIRDADNAMYQAKSAGKGRVVVFDSVMHERAVDRLRLEQDMRAAIEREEFVLHYQPIVDLHRGRTGGFEALIRWEHPERGLIPPDDFIPIAEETGLIVEVGRLVSRAAAAQLVEWNRGVDEADRLFVNVNLSKRELLDFSIVEWLVACCEEHGLRPSDLHVEVTESVIVDQRADVTPVLRGLREAGFQIVMDDFGTGLSSLGTLHSYPVDVMKIDKSFIQSLDSNRALLALVSSITTLADNLDMPTVVEGVETLDVVGALQSINCRWGQGYYFSRPIPAEDVSGYLERERDGGGVRAA